MLAWSDDSVAFDVISRYCSASSAAATLCAVERRLLDDGVDEVGARHQDEEQDGERHDDLEEPEPTLRLVWAVAPPLPSFVLPVPSHRLGGATAPAHEGRG